MFRIKVVAEIYGCLPCYYHDAKHRYLWGRNTTKILCSMYIGTCLSVTTDGVGLVIRFNENLQNVTTNNYGAISNSHTLQFTTACTVFSVCCVFTSGRSPASGFTFSQAGGHLTPSSYFSNCRLKTRHSNGSWPSLSSLGTHRIENTFQKFYCCVRVLLQSLPNNGHCLQSNYLANGCFIAYFAVVAKQRVYMPQYISGAGTGQSV
jgi:hypothetical protein